MKLKLNCFFIALIVIINSTYAQWVTTNKGLIGNAHVYCFAQSGANIFAGTFMGVYLSSDNGNTWNEVNKGIKELTIKSLLINSNNIFAGTMEGINISANNGKLWAPVNSGLKYKNIRSLAASGTNIFVGVGGAGGDGGIYLSNNNGALWVEKNNGLANKFKVLVHTLAISGNNVFAGTDEGVFLSINNGTTWKAVNKGLPTETNSTTTWTKSIMAIAINGTNIYAGTQGDGVYLSTNNGLSWTSINTGLPFIKYTSSISYPQVTSILVNGTTVFVGFESLYGSEEACYLYMSANNGKNWMGACDGLKAKLPVLSMISDETSMYIGTYGEGIWKRSISDLIVK